MVGQATNCRNLPQTLQQIGHKFHSSHIPISHTSKNKHTTKHIVRQTSTSISTKTQSDRRSCLSSHLLLLLFLDPLSEIGFLTGSEDSFDTSNGKLHWTALSLFPERLDSTHCTAWFLNSLCEDISEHLRKMSLSGCASSHSFSNADWRSLNLQYGRALRSIFLHQ